MDWRLVFVHKKRDRLRRSPEVNRPIARRRNKAAVDAEFRRSPDSACREPRAAWADGPFRERHDRSQSCRCAFARRQSRRPRVRDASVTSTRRRRRSRFPKRGRGEEHSGLWLSAGKSARRGVSTSDRCQADRQLSHLLVVAEMHAADAAAADAHHVFEGRNGNRRVLLICPSAHMAAARTSGSADFSRDSMIFAASSF